MRVFSCFALSIAFACASTAAIAGSTPPKKILFTRDLLEKMPGSQFDAPAAAALYVVDGNRHNLHRLTPLQEGHYYIPGVESNAYVWTENSNMDWLSRNFSATGQILFFNGLASSFPTYADSLSGKYKIRDPNGHVRNLFPGQDDVASGWGFVTWGPPGSRLIAFTNSAKARVASPACVYLIHPDGSGAHTLWCPTGYSSPVGVTDLRWSGNGKYLLAYVNWDPYDDTYSNRDLWRIKVATGEATRVATNVAVGVDYGTDDISYDGNKVLFTANGIDDPSEGGCEAVVNDPPAKTLCLADLTNGRQLRVLAQDPTGNTLISPGGNRTLRYEFGTPLGQDYPGYSEIDIFLIRTSDGSKVRQLTRPPADGWPQGSYVTWRAVAFSRDGKKLLANRDVRAAGKVIPTTDFFIINLVDNRVYRVGKGNAVDWYQPQ